MKDVTVARFEQGTATDLPKERQDSIRDGISTREGEDFDDDALARDLERIGIYYQSLGYYGAWVAAARVVPDSSDDGAVRVYIEIQEGVPVRVRAVTTPGLERLTPEERELLTDDVALAEGDVFTHSSLTKTANILRTALANQGYAYAEVKGDATVAVSDLSANLTFQVELGPRTTIGPVKVVGLHEVSEEIVRNYLGFHEGDPYTASALEEGRRSLLRLQALTQITVRPDLSDKSQSKVPITVEVRENSLRSVYVGLGVRADSAKATLLGNIGWEDLNFFGGLRRFLFDVTPGLVMYPTTFDFSIDRNVLAGGAASAQLEQPSFLEAKTTGVLRGQYSVEPLLYSNISVTDPVVGFQQIANRAGLSRQFFEVLTLRPSYNLIFDFPFSYVGELQDGLSELGLSYPELEAILDFRDDPVEPTRGVYAGLRVQFAGGPFFGDATDLKLEPEMRGYVPLGQLLGGRLTLALRGAIGMLFPAACDADGEPQGCYADSLETDASNASPEVVRDQQILAFRALYSGGANSNRGYNDRGVGPHGVVSFLTPPNVDCSVDVELRSCNHALGGLTRWEASMELRWAVADPVAVAFFLDASDVTRGRFDFRLNVPHLSAGSGFRVLTPVGAVRADLGVRLPGLQQIGEDELPPSEGFTDTLGGFPGAFHFSIGQAY